jgi:osmoprotectant transport system permease protein
MHLLTFKAYRFTLLVILVAAGVFIERAGFIKYLSDPFEMRFTINLILQHINMVIVSISAAAFIGLTIGIIFTRPKFKKYSGVVMYIVGLGQTVPSLAVIAISMSFIGIGFKAAVLRFVYIQFCPLPGIHWQGYPLCNHGSLMRPGESVCLNAEYFSD